jgi:hypothetical protein
VASRHPQSFVFSLQKFVDDFIARFVDVQCKTVNCKEERIKKYVDNYNNNKGNNGFCKSVFRGLKAIPPKPERSKQNYKEK